MLDEKKIHLMSKVAVYEHNRDGGSIRTNRYFEKRSKNAVFFYSIPAGVITFLLLCAVVLGVDSKWAVSFYETAGSVVTIVLGVMIMILFVIIYALFSRVMFKRRYEKSRGTFWKYNFYKNKLQEIAEQEADNRK